MIKKIVSITLILCCKINGMDLSRQLIHCSDNQTDFYTPTKQISSQNSTQNNPANATDLPSYKKIAISQVAPFKASKKRKQRSLLDWDQYLFRCSVCHTRTNRIDHLNRHFTSQKHHDNMKHMWFERDHTCLHCQFGTNSINEFDKHSDTPKHKERVAQSAFVSYK